jgi:hypothetical protein
VLHVAPPDANLTSTMATPRLPKAQLSKASGSNTDQAVDRQWEDSASVRDPAGWADFFMDPDRASLAGSDQGQLGAVDPFPLRLQPAAECHRRTAAPVLWTASRADVCRGRTSSRLSFLVFVAVGAVSR